MPFVNVKTNISVPYEKDAALHTALDQAVALLPAVEPGWTMTNIEADHRIWYEGTQAPAAMVEISVYGNILDGCEAVTAQVSALLHQQLGIEIKRIYVKFVQASHWGSNGMNY